MQLHTASEIISFAKKLENESAELYQSLSLKFTKGENVFLSFVRENRKNVVQIERAYYGVITDAIEGCFAFDLNPDEYKLKNDLAEQASYSDALRMALETERKIIKFYFEAAEQSKSLLADVPRNFVLVAKKRNSRIVQLESLVDKTG